MALKMMRNWLIGGFLSYIALCFILFVFQRNLMYVPHTDVPDPIQYQVQDIYELMQVETSDGLMLNGWYFHSSDAQGTKTILLYHGNAWHMGARAFKAKRYHAAGYNVLLASWRGFGGNPGKPSQEGLYRDARAYFDWLATAKNVREEDIILYGESLGTGIASKMASENRGVAALILEAPYTSFMDLANRTYFFVPNFLLLRDRYSNMDYADEIRTPVFIIHGALDAVVPVTHAKRVYHAVNNPKYLKIYPAAGHNDLYSFGAGEDVLEFLSTLEESL